MSHGALKNLKCTEENAQARRLAPPDVGNRARAHGHECGEGEYTLTVAETNSASASVKDSGTLTID